MLIIQLEPKHLNNTFLYFLKIFKIYSYNISSNAWRVTDSLGGRNPRPSVTRLLVEVYLIFYNASKLHSSLIFSLEI